MVLGVISLKYLVSSGKCIRLLRSLEKIYIYFFFAKTTWLHLFGLRLYFISEDKVMPLIGTFFVVFAVKKFR